MCGALEVQNTLTLLGGSLEVGGHSRLAAPLRILDGSFNGFAGIEADNSEEVAGDLATAGDWTVRSPAHVGGAAFVAGSLEASTRVDVGGVLYAAHGNTTNVHAAEIRVDGTVATSRAACPVQNALPSAIWGMDGVGIVELGSALTHDSHAARLSLGCGRYRFDSWGIERDLVLRVSGATLIVIEGDVRIAAPVRIELDAGATLDVLVAGSLRVDDTLTITGGSAWLAVEGQLDIASPMVLEGSLYAPHSVVAVNDALDVTGSLWVGSMRIAAPVTVAALPARTAPPCTLDGKL